MPREAAVKRKQSLAYNIFILVITVLSLIFMVLLLFPLAAQTIDLLRYYDNLFCFIFLIDFLITLNAVPSPSEYFFRRGGWLDLLGSIPTFGTAFRFTALLRLARLNRLIRILRQMSGMKMRDLVRDVVQYRSQYALFITLLAAILVLTTASLLVLQFESQSPQANIRTGGESIWYSIVTITTVGYGDYYPVTTGGRIAGVFIMMAGVGIIGALASILASVLIGPGTNGGGENNPEAPSPQAVEQELAAIRNELALMRQMMEKMAADEKKG
jgi:voltage-gated potassium channel